VHGLQLEGPSAEHARLRTVIAAVDRQISSLPGRTPGTRGEEGATPEGLRASWTELLALLAVGPAPEFRECPSCSAAVMRAATRCGYCWVRLTPFPAIPEEALEAPAE
jgi:hypothetical protein